MTMCGYVDDEDDDMAWMTERDLVMYEMLRQASVAAADNYKNKAWLRWLTEQVE